MIVLTAPKLSAYQYSQRHNLPLIWMPLDPPILPHSVPSPFPSRTTQGAALENASTSWDTAHWGQAQPYQYSRQFQSFQQTEYTAWWCCVSPDQRMQASRYQPEMLALALITFREAFQSRPLLSQKSVRIARGFALRLHQIHGWIGRDGLKAWLWKTHLQLLGYNPWWFWRIVY